MKRASERRADPVLAFETWATRQLAAEQLVLLQEVVNPGSSASTSLVLTVQLRLGARDVHMHVWVI
jgi:hypothetical protein